MIPEKQTETNIKKLQQILSRPFYKAQNYTLGAIQKSLYGYWVLFSSPSSMESLDLFRKQKY
jgi:hypothetical protein